MPHMYICVNYVIVENKIGQRYIHIMLRVAF